MFNGHYVPESLFESQSESKHVGLSKGISETTPSAEGHRVLGTLHYETILKEGDVDVKGIQLNLSGVADVTVPVSQGLRISYSRSPSPVILRIAQMDVVDSPFADVDAWVNPPEDKVFSSMDKAPIEPAFTYGTLKNYGHECDVISCRAHDLSGLVSDRYKKLRVDMSQRLIKFRAECRDHEDDKPFHCRVYEHRTTGSLVIVGLVILMIYFLLRPCRACCFFVLHSVGRKSERGASLRDESHTKEV
jgi:hypothetical protein